MPYKIYTDRDEEFICEVSVKNASLKDSMARIILESNGLTVAFKGVIRNGKCVVPIKRVKGLFEENTTGRMHLELIVDNMYFKPWESTFQVEENTSVKVRVDEQTAPASPAVTTLPPKKEVKIKYDATQDILWICERFNINKKTLPYRRKDFKTIIAEYFKSTPGALVRQKEILKEVSQFFK